MLRLISHLFAILLNNVKMYTSKTTNFFICVIKIKIIKYFIHISYYITDAYSGKYYTSNPPITIH